MGALFLRFPEGKAKALTLSYDDGVEHDIQLMGILKKYGLKGTFNLNSGLYAGEGTVYSKTDIHRRLTREQVTELYTDSGMEVAAHGLTHAFPLQSPDPALMKELVQDRENLEQQFHTIVRGLAYAFGHFDDRVVECVRKAGLVYARTIISSHSFAIPEDWLRLKPTCHHNDPQLKELEERFLNSKKREPQLFYLWGHSYEFEEKDNWNVIEEFARNMGGREDIWYATNIQVYDYTEAWKQIQFSVDGHIAHNPTAVKVWFAKDDTEYSLLPGETVFL